MHIAESRIIGLNVAHDGSGLIDVTLERVLVAPDVARGLAVGDSVSLEGGPAGWTQVHGTDASEYKFSERPGIEELGRAAADRVDLAPPESWINSPIAKKIVRMYQPPPRPEAPAFQSATDHEIGIAYCKGLTYQYAYPKGAQPADACRWSHIDETEVREELWDIQPGDIVYDIGSAFGSYALSALAAGAAHVVCFNPNPDEQRLLLESANLNGWQGKVLQYNEGLWSERGYLNDEEQTFTKESGEFKVTKTADGRHTQLFAVQPLDSLGVGERGLGRSVVKMDVEGAEVEVLKGARAFFAQVEPAFVLIEKHVFKDPSLDARTDEAMADLGYVLVTNRPYHSVVHALYRMKGWDD